MNVNTLKKKFLFDADTKNDLDAPIDIEGIKRVIPNREPFLFIDRIELINLERRLIKTTRWIDPEDPVFRGHFPDNPIYPGVLQQEILYESLALLLYFVLNNTTKIPESAYPVRTVGTRVYDCLYLSPVVPDSLVSVYCCIPEMDDFLTTGVGQVCVGETICSIGKGELYAA